MSQVKTIGILTSGGDAPGMNAAVRAVVRKGLHNGLRVIGFNRGYNGLLKKDYRDMTPRSVSNIIENGGTALYSARCLEFKDPSGVAQGVNNCLELGIDGLVVIGGDGSFRGARDLSLSGIPCIGIPGTIDNDIPSTDYSIGFDTALNTIVENIDRLRDTSESHDRCSVVEVMGHRCGDLAVEAAVCCGAVAVLVPEVPFDLQKDVFDKMSQAKEHGKTNFIVITAEGVTGIGLGKDPDLTADSLAKEIQAKTQVETRATILGHIQRGGSPTGRDRLLGSRMGYYAVQLLLEGKGNRVVCERCNSITDFDILEALQMTRPVDEQLLKIAEEISV